MFSDLSQRCACWISIACSVLFTLGSGGTIQHWDPDDWSFRWTPFPWQIETTTQSWDDNNYSKYPSSSSSNTFFWLIIISSICLGLALVFVIKFCKNVCSDEGYCTSCDHFITCCDKGSSHSTTPTVHSSSRMNVQQPESSNPRGFATTDTSAVHFQTISFSNVREDLSRALSRSPHLHEEISSRTAGLHSSPPRTRDDEEPNTPEFQMSFVNIREDLFRTMSDSSYLNEEISFRTAELHSRPSRTSAVVHSISPGTISAEAPSFDNPPEYSAVVSSDLTEQVNFPEVRSLDRDMSPPTYDENNFPNF